jgi:hypothetical protein
MRIFCISRFGSRIGVMLVQAVRGTHPKSHVDQTSQDSRVLGRHSFRTRMAVKIDLVLPVTDL